MPPKTTSQILSEASKRALGGGLPGAAAMGVNVCTLMPLRTTMNYQVSILQSSTDFLDHL